MLACNSGQRDDRSSRATATGTEARIAAPPPAPVDFADYPQAVADYLTANPDAGAGLACLYELFDAWDMPYFSGDRSCRAGNTDADDDEETAVVLATAREPSIRARTSAGDAVVTASATPEHVPTPTSTPSADDCSAIYYQVAVLDPSHAGYTVTYSTPTIGLSCNAENLLGNVIVDMGDLNGDGGGELAYAMQWCGAHTCGVNLHIVSGSAAGYAELTPPTRDPTGGILMETPIRVEFRDDDADGVMELVLAGGHINSAGAGPQRTRTETYAWDGRLYSLRERVLGRSSLRYHWVIDADSLFRKADFAGAAEKYHIAATNPSFGPPRGPDELKDNEATELSAYALFRAALARLAVGGPDEAALGYLAEARALDAPLHGPIVAAFADAYLSQEDLSGACAAVNEVVQAKSDALKEFWYYGYANPPFDPAAMCPF
jgi:hypothetical protein